MKNLQTRINKLHKKDRVNFYKWADNFIKQVEKNIEIKNQEKAEAAVREALGLE